MFVCLPFGKTFRWKIGTFCETRASPGRGCSTTGMAVKQSQPMAVCSALRLSKQALRPALAAISIGLPCRPLDLPGICFACTAKRLSTSNVVAL